MKIKIKKGRSITLFFLVTTVFFAISLTSNNIFDVGNISDKEERTNFDYYKLISSQVSNKIYIVGDQGWIDFKSDGNCTGLGTFSDPYIIKDIVIDSKNSGSGIIIENSTVYFKIVNVTIYNSGNHWLSENAGIKLQSSNNGSLINNTVGNNHYGIVLLDSHNTTISGNIADEIFLGAGEGVGIYILNSENNTISGNTLYNNEGYAILLINGNSSFISGNIVSRDGSGIGIDNSNDIIISGNTVTNNDYMGIRVDNSNDIIISGNIANYNRDFGIFVRGSINTMISGNTANNTDRGSGISVLGCDNTMISGNTANNNNRSSGISILECDNTMISGNTANNNDRGSGIRVYECDNTFISENSANNNEQGIVLYLINGNTISHNNITYNTQYGIQLVDSDGNTISHNNITYNGQYGLYLYESNNNLIIGNNLLFNEIPINERNCAGNNYQNNIIDESPFFPIFIVVPIFIGIIFLITTVVFIYKKRVTNKKQQIL